MKTKRRVFKDKNKITRIENFNDDGKLIYVENFTTTHEILKYDDKGNLLHPIENFD